jgi:uncharacterized protein YndB with AHSA1/START domain
MAEAKKIAAPVTLRMKRTMPFPRERVFAAFSQPEQMDRWMCRDTKNHQIKYLKFDFRVGGGFDLEIPHAQRPCLRDAQHLRGNRRASENQVQLELSAYRS